MIRIAAIALALAFSAPAAAAGQDGSAYQPPDVAEQAEKISALSFLTGEWVGEGWTYAGPNRKIEFKQTEEIFTMLDGAILTIHGTGLARNAKPGADPIFEAYAIVSWDDEADAYRFRSYANGHVGDFDAELAGDGVFVWRLPSIEYRITVTGDQWVETGHRALPNGERVQFFEMTLMRK